MKSAERGDVLGFILNPEETEKLRVVADYMGLSPHQLVSNSVQNLYEAYRDQVDG